MLRLDCMDKELKKGEIYENQFYSNVRFGFSNIIFRY